MYSTQCSLELGNERYIEVCALNNGEPKIELREFKQTEKYKVSNQLLLITII